MTKRNVPIDSSRRRFLRTSGIVTGSIALGVSASGVGAAQQPAFDEQIYGDGVAWGTKGVTELPPPTDDNEQSFDPLVFIVDEYAPGNLPVQLPVSEAAPGNPDYNGGRWISLTVTVEEPGEYDPSDPIKDYDDLLAAQGAGILSSSIDGAPLEANGDPFRPDYFECPLLPVKD